MNYNKAAKSLTFRRGSEVSQVSIRATRKIHVLVSVRAKITIRV